MNSNTEKGKFILFAAAAWIIIKVILNFVIDLIRGNGNLGGFLLGAIIAVIIAAAMFYLPEWIKYVVAVYLIAVFLQGLIPNLKSIIGWGFIYLGEGLIDLLLAYLLLFNTNVSEFYKNK